MDFLKESLAPRTFNKISYAVVLIWFVISVIFFGIFAEVENTESRYDFRCGGTKSENMDLIRGECFEKYQKQYNKYGVPVYGFVIINFLLIGIVCVIYSQIVKNAVDHLSSSSRNSDPESGQSRDQENPTGQTTNCGHKLFIAYCCQLSTRLVLGVLFILLQTQLLYPLKFSSTFECYLNSGTSQPRNSSNAAPNSTLHKCHNQRAIKKTFWMNAVLAVNGIFDAGILIEIVYILTQAWIKRNFMQDSDFLKTYLNANHDKSHNVLKQPEGTSGHDKPEQLQPFIERTKKIIKEDTQCLYELQSPFRRPPGAETEATDLTLDQIYTNLVIIPNRVTYNFTTDRQEQLKVYPRSHDEESHPKSLEDLLNDKNKKVLIVGRPGIGKTLCCIKLLRDWAFEKVKSQIQFDAAFFVKFRRFNSADDLSLRELLTRSEHSTSDHLDDEVWNYILQHPEGVLILFDGFDEFKDNANMAVAPSHPGNIKDKMPLQILYQWLVTGKLLEDASIVTTTRPTALTGIAHLNFDKTFEILGFSTEQIQEYTNKFAGVDNQVGETLWRHISSNMNLLSLCYVPVNSFIICSSLSQILQFESSASVTLPSKLTTIYKIAVKVFYFKHTKEFRDKHFTREDFLSDDLPSAVEGEFEKLGRVAFEGIKEGKLILGGNEVREMKDSALFHRLPDREHTALKDEKQFCFIHLTMQEFFAARHLTNNMKERELRNFVSENIKNGKWQLVFQFLAGLMEEKNHLPSEIITDLLPVQTEEKKNEAEESEDKMTCWPTKDEKDLAVTLLKCSYESNKMESIVQRKLQQINFNCVNFIDCHLTAVGCSSLANVIKNVQQISHLDLSLNNIGPLGCFEICKLLKCRESQLSWLNLTRNQLTDKAAKYLAKAINSNNSQLRTLNLSENNISHIGTRHLAEAINNCQLRTFNLSENNISHIGTRHLAEAINNNNCQLRTLYLRASNISDFGAQNLADAINNNNCQLHTLDLSLNNISEIGAQHLADAINNNNNCQLHTLDLSYNDISDIGAQHLADAINNNNCQLRTLNLSYNNISHIGAQHLADAINNNNCQLHTLHLSDNNISDIGAQHLAEAINNNNNCQLHTLYLSYNNISDIGAQHLADAINNNNCQLHTLNLSHNNISHIGAQHLAEAINNNNCQLRMLYLSHNNISDIGAQHLAEAINNNNCQLRTLNLTHNNISDIGAQHLAEAINNNNCQLRTLNLIENNISDIGAQHLAEAINNNSNSQLRTLNLTTNQHITNAGKQKARNLLSDCRCKLIL
ncbi:NLR family CARD domain-containing protein 3-like [Pocillopora verrucosa]|uniref:NLR family CARD domain-containing protein 3-like n=1 Tax=Pocillopora verrucosa TaxID=203993 RepID=UPI003341FB93